MESNLANTINLFGPNINVTCGNFAVETEAQAWLVGFLRNCQDRDGNLFFRYVEEQRSGVPLFLHHRQKTEKDYRCDIIALPAKKPASEWFGAIVFEVKRSGEKIGPPLSQLKDYLAGVFDVSGIQVAPSFGFLFPCLKQHAAVASFMQHQSMGCVYENERGHVLFFSGEERLLEFDSNRRCIAMNRPKSGRGCGSR